MGRLLLVKNTSLLFLLISASFLSASFAGKGSNSENRLLAQGVDATATYEETSSRASENTQVSNDTHKRLLKANTRDYGNYNPSPALVRPPFKLIPN